MSPSCFGLIQARPVPPAWKCLTLKSDPRAKPLPTPFCSAGDGKGHVPGTPWREICMAHRGRFHPTCPETGGMALTQIPWAVLAHPLLCPLHAHHPMQGDMLPLLWTSPPRHLLWFPRAAAPVGVFSRGTTRISGSLSCGAREVRSPCAWRGGLPWPLLGQS